MKNEVRYHHLKVLENEEHDDADTGTKKVSLYGLDTSDLTKKRITVKEVGGEVYLNTNTEGIATEAKQDAIVTAIENITIPAPVGGATEAKQDASIVIDTAIKTLLTTLNSLTETLQYLTARLGVIAGMANSGAPALRTIPIASVSTAVSGSLTTVTNLTNFGTAMPATEMAHDINNTTVVLANINNVVIS